MLISGISFADDINMFLRNSWDNKAETADSKKTQVLFLIDLPEGGEKECFGTYTCYEIAADGGRGDLLDGTGDCPAISGDSDSGGSCAAECFNAGEANPAFQYNNAFPGYSSPNINANNILYSGCFCPNDSDGSSSFPAYWKVEDCKIPGMVDVRPVLEKVMADRPDIKYGVMALNKSAAADMILPIELRTTADLAKGAAPGDEDGEDRQKLYAATFPTLDDPSIDAAVFPTLGGMQSVEEYLAGEMVGYESPLTNDCKYTQLIVITNGGWKNDVVADAEAELLQLATDMKDSVVKSDCSARVATSVIGVDVPEDDSTNYPLFESGADSVAQAMAENGGGFYENVQPDDNSQVAENKQIGTGIYEAILDVIDFSYKDPTALITPVAPVSISRSHNLDLFYASAFKAQPGSKWPGNLAQGKISSTPDPLDFDNSSSLSFPATREILTICANGEGLCPLAIDTDAGFTAEDIAWLKGESVTTAQDLLGDVIHFRPLPIHYGADADDIYLFLGSNRGLLHCFNKSGREQWAFLPPQLKPLISALRQGNTAPQWSMVNHFYGVDGAPSTFIYDGNKDGKISSNEDLVMLYYGLRRGGAGYFAMDITTPTSPQLKWTAGGSDLNYGSKPDAEIVSGDQDAEDEEEIPAVAGSGGCPMYRFNVQSGCISSQVCSLGSVPLELNGSGDQIDVPLIGREAGILSFEVIYFDKMVGSTPHWTIYNKCIPEIGSDENEYTFDAHPTAMAAITLAQSGACLVGASANDQAAGEMKRHMGLGPGGGSAGEFETLVAFDLSGLPEDITITDAQITFAHTGYGSQQEAINIYQSGVEVYASAKGYYGDHYGLDGTTSGQGDCVDSNHFSGGSIAAIDAPEGNSIAFGSRTTDGVLNLTTDQLTNLLINGRYNDSRNHKWVQFKIKRSSTASNETLMWGRAFEGPAAANHEGDGYWDAIVPKLTLKWEVADSSDPVLTIKQIGSYGSVQGKLSAFDTDPFNCLDAECSKTYTQGDSVTLTATGDDFEGWIGDCTVNSYYANKCTVTMDQPKEVTAKYKSTTPNLILDIEGGSGSVEVNYASVSTSLEDSVNTVAISEGVDVTLTPESLSDFESWADWSGVAESCDNATKVCTFTMPANDVSVTANFKVKYTVAASISGEGGESISPPTQLIESGLTADIAVTAAENFKIKTVTGCGGDGSALIGETSGTYTTASVSADCTGANAVVATFEAVGGDADTFNLNLTAVGDGIVVPTPGGSDCSPVVAGCSAHDVGTTVTVNADVNDSNYIIKSWSGCSGSGVGSGSGTCDVTAAADVTVTFVPKCTKVNYTMGYLGNYSSDHIKVCSDYYHACATGDGGQLGPGLFGSGNNDVYLHPVINKGYSSEAACEAAVAP